MRSGSRSKVFDLLALAGGHHVFHADPVSLLFEPTVLLLAIV